MSTAVREKLFCSFYINKCFIGFILFNVYLFCRVAADDSLGDVYNVCNVTRDM